MYIYIYVIIYICISTIKPSCMSSEPTDTIPPSQQTQTPVGPRTAARCAAASSEGWRSPRGLAPLRTGAGKKRVTWRVPPRSDLSSKGRFHHICIFRMYKYCQHIYMR